MALQGEINVLERLATALKALLLKQGKGAVKGLSLERAEQKRYDALPQA